MTTVKEYIKTLLKLAINNNPEVLKVIKNSKTKVDNDKWITIHPNGEENKGRPLLLKDGETPKEAIERTYGGKKEASDKQEGEKKTNITLPKKPNIILEKNGKTFIKIQTTGGLKTVSGIRKNIDGIDVLIHEREKDWDMSPYSVSDIKTGMQLAKVDTKNAKGLTFKNVLETYNKLIKQYPIINIDEEEQKHKKITNSKTQNNKEQDMALIDELKKLITKVENDKGEDMDKEKAKNEKVDKRKLIDEVAGIMKSAGADDELIRTAIGKMEKIAYDKSEAGTADNACDDDEEEVKNKKVRNEETEKDEEEYEDLKKDVKEDVKNKCKNSVDNAKGGYFDKMNEIYNSAIKPTEENTYISREQKLKNAEEYFAK